MCDMLVMMVGVVVLKDARQRGNVHCSENERYNARRDEREAKL